MKRHGSCICSDECKKAAAKAAAFLRIKQGSILNDDGAIRAQDGLTFGTAEGFFFSMALEPLIPVMDLCAAVRAQEVIGTAKKTETYKE